MCLGDGLARMELFLFFSNLLHMFRIESPADQPLPSLKGNAGVTLTPDKHKVSACVEVSINLATLFVKNVTLRFILNVIYSYFYLHIIIDLLKIFKSPHMQVFPHFIFP